MSPKWAKKAHFGDISYDVFNRRKSSNLILEVSQFIIFCRITHPLWNDYQKFAVLSKGIIAEEKMWATFWCNYRISNDTSLNFLIFNCYNLFNIWKVNDDRLVTDIMFVIPETWKIQKLSIWQTRIFAKVNAVLNSLFENT